TIFPLPILYYFPVLIQWGILHYILVLIIWGIRKCPPIILHLLMFFLREWFVAYWDGTGFLLVSCINNICYWNNTVAGCIDNICCWNNTFAECICCGLSTRASTC